MRRSLADSCVHLPTHAANKSTVRCWADLGCSRRHCCGLTDSIRNAGCNSSDAKTTSFCEIAAARHLPTAQRPPVLATPDMSMCKMNKWRCPCLSGSHPVFQWRHRLYSSHLRQRAIACFGGYPRSSPFQTLIHSRPRKQEELGRTPFPLEPLPNRTPLLQQFLTQS
ncbi:hypothetical protein VTK26DRAFT_4162 [Humicola hyalothermophila]